LEEINNADNGAPCSAQHLKKVILVGVISLVSTMKRSIVTSLVCMSYNPIQCGEIA
jgi:hypothetical protein